MSSNFNYPFQRGTESLPTDNPNQRLGGVRQLGGEPNDEFTLEVMERNSALIDDFINTSRELANLSGLPIYQNHLQYPEFDAHYINQYGKEHINVVPRAERPEQKKKIVEEIIPDIMYDGYIGVLTVNPSVPPPTGVTQVSHNVQFNYVWVYVPGWTPPEGYAPNFNLYQVLPSSDGYSYGVMRFDAWYRGLGIGEAQLSWVVFDSTINGLKWVGPADKKYILKFVSNLRVPSIPYIIDQWLDNPSLGINLNSFYIDHSGFISYYLHGANPLSQHSFDIKLNGGTLYNYIGEPNTVECLIFRFGPNALRSHSYRDEITKKYLESNSLPKLLHKISPVRSDPNNIFKELLPAYCGLDDGFWKGTCQMYDNYYTNQYVPITIRDMGEFDLSLINDEENIVEIHWPKEVVLYEREKFLQSDPPPPLRNVTNAVGTVTTFAEFFSRNSSDFRFVDQSWHYLREEGKKYLVNDKPRYFFPDAVQLQNFTNGDIIATNNIWFNVMSPTINNAVPNYSINPQSFTNGYMFKAKSPNPFIGNIGTAIKPLPGEVSEITDFIFKFNLKSSEQFLPITNIGIEVTVDTPPNVVSNSIIRPTTGIEFTYPIPNDSGIQLLRSNYDIGGYSSSLTLFWLRDLSFSTPAFENSVKNSPLYPMQKEYRDAQFSENGVQDWLLFVRSLYCGYILGDGKVSPTTHITDPQAEEQFLKE